MVNGCYPVKIPYLQLISILKMEQNPIVQRWVELLRAHPGSGFKDLPVEVLEDYCWRGLIAIIEAFSENSFTPTEQFMEETSEISQRLGIPIGVEMIVNSILMTQEAALPIILQHINDEEIQRTLKSELDRVVHQVTGRLVGIYEHAVNRSLTDQQKSLRLMLEAAQVASHSLDLHHVLQELAHFVAQAVAAPYCLIYLTDATQPALRPFIGVANFPGTVLDDLQTYTLDPNKEPLVRLLIDERKPLVIDDIQENPIYFGNGIRNLGVRSLLVAPIVRYDRLLGIVAVAGLDSPNRFTQKDVEMVEGITNSSALALDNARLYEETRQRLTETQSLQQVTEAILMKKEQSEALQIVCDALMLITGAKISAMIVLEESGYGRVVYQIGAPELADYQFSTRDAGLSQVIESRLPILDNQPVLPPLPMKKINSILLACARLKDQPIGIISLANKPGGFTQEDARVINLFADQAALAVQSTRLHRQVEQLAIIEERQRLARELHDSVTQELYAMTLYAEAASRLLASDDRDAVGRYLQELRDTSMEALREMRVLIFELRPPVLARDGLVAALQSRLEAVEGRAGLQTDFHVIGDIHLPFDIEEDIYRITQEALNNAFKHSMAQKITLTIQQCNELLRVIIQDDGVGFSRDDAIQSAGMGLKTMQERCDRIGAKLDIQTQAGQGSRLSVELKLAQNGGIKTP